MTRAIFYVASVRGGVGGAAERGEKARKRAIRGQKNVKKHIFFAKIKKFLKKSLQIQKIALTLQRFSKEHKQNIIVS